MAKSGTILIIFLQFFLFFFQFFRQFSWPIMTCLLFFEHLDALLAEMIFSLDLYAFSSFPVF